MPLRVLRIFPIVILASCGDTLVGPPRGNEPVQMDATAYRLHFDDGLYEAGGVARYTNTGTTDIHYKRCRGDSDGPMYGIRRESEGRSFIGHAWLCVGGVPTGRIGPGETIEVPVWLGSTESPNASPPILMEHRTGFFRVVLELCEEAVDDSDDCTLLPEHERWSNLFEVLPPD